MRWKDATLYYGISTKILLELLGRGYIRGIECGERQLIDCETADAYFASLPNMFTSINGMEQALEEAKQEVRRIRPGAKI
jgi:hypothetical protein